MQAKLIFAGLLIAAAPIAPLAAQTPVTVQGAVAATSRNADNLKLDASRKPAEILGWAGLAPGMNALDVFGANLYWAEIMAPVVSPKGHVTIWEPTQFADEKIKASVGKFAQSSGNTELLVSPMEAPELPANAYDFAMINLNYHDVYWESEKFKIPRMEPGPWLQRLNAAMKPGGTVVVIDHVAKSGAPRETVEKFHRIDPEVVKADFCSAGFELVKTGDLLANPSDDYAVGVFDPKVRGKTDRFAFKFRKAK